MTIQQYWNSRYKVNPSKAELVQQAQLSIDRLWSRGLMGEREYQPAIRELERLIKENKNNIKK